MTIQFSCIIALIFYSFQSFSQNNFPREEFELIKQSAKNYQEHLAKESSHAFLMSMGSLGSAGMVSGPYVFYLLNKSKANILRKDTEIRFLSTTLGKKESLIRLIEQLSLGGKNLDHITHSFLKFLQNPSLTHEVKEIAIQKLASNYQNPIIKDIFKDLSQNFVDIDRELSSKFSEIIDFQMKKSRLVTLKDQIKYYLKDLPQVGEEVVNEIVQTLSENQIKINDVPHILTDGIIELQTHANQIRLERLDILTEDESPHFPDGSDSRLQNMDRKIAHTDQQIASLEEILAAANRSESHVQWLTELKNIALLGSEVEYGEKWYRAITRASSTKMENAKRLGQKIYALVLKKPQAIRRAVEKIESRAFDFLSRSQRGVIAWARALAKKYPFLMQLINPDGKKLAIGTTLAAAPLLAFSYFKYTQSRQSRNVAREIEELIQKIDMASGNYKYQINTWKTIYNISQQADPAESSLKTVLDYSILLDFAHSYDEQFCQEEK